MFTVYNAPNASQEDTEVIINGPIMFRGSVFRATGITFDGYPGATTGVYANANVINCNEGPIVNTKILFDNCTIKNYYNIVMSGYDNNIEMDNCIIENVNNIKNSNSGCIYIKNSSITDVIHIDVSSVSDIVLSNTRFTRTNIGRYGKEQHIKVVCYGNEQVDNFIYDYLRNNMTIGTGYGIDLDIMDSFNAPAENSPFGVSYVKGVYRCFDAGLANKGFWGLLCKTFPIRYIDNFNNAPADFKNLFTGLFSYFYTDISTNKDHYVRILKTTEGSTTTVTAIEVTPDGRTYYNKKGTVRPTMYFSEDVGNNFYDTSVNKMIYWTGDTTLGANGWVDANGNNPDA